MINMVLGNPGSGKGRWSTELTIDEIINGKRPIITNLPLQLLPWLNAKFQPMLGLQGYLRREKQRDFDCLNRVFHLPDDECDCFYLWRVKNGRMVKQEASVRKTVKDGIEEERVMDYDTKIASECGGVWYLIDEAWKFFSARRWQKTGEGMLFYSAQHRHFGDDVFIATQNTKQVDTAIVRLTNNFWVCENHGNKTFGIFRRPSVFTVNIYDSPPTGVRQAPMSRKVFMLDAKGIAQCYDTSAGVGIVGRTMADLDSRKRGLPAWSMAAIAILAILLLFKGVAFGEWLLTEPFKKMRPASNVSVVQGQKQSEKVKLIVSKESELVAVEAEKSAPGVQTPAVESIASSLSVELVTNDVYVTGWTIQPGQQPRLFLSNGRWVNPSLVRALFVDRVEFKDGSTLSVREFKPGARGAAFADEKTGSQEVRSERVNIGGIMVPRPATVTVIGQGSRGPEDLQGVQGGSIDSEMRQNFSGMPQPRQGSIGVTTIGQSSRKLYGQP